MIESELGEGSCFTVVIPFRLDRQAKAQEKEEAADADITGLRILVAEDNELNMEIARFILEDCGALVEPVSNVIGGSLCFITMLVTILPELNKMENSR